MTLNRVWMPSPNYSSRGGASVRLIVIHTAEGARTIESLGSFFASPSAGVSSHAGADDKANTVGEYVKRPNKAWTQADANPVAVSLELCGFAAWSPAEWDDHPDMLENCASWIREESAAFGIPIMRLTPAQAQGGGRGVCAHSDLGAWGGNHSDPGPGFPWDLIIEMAGGGAGPIEEDDLTPEQDQLLREIFNMLLSGVGEWQGNNPKDVSWLWNHLVNGVNSQGATMFGALTTLDSLGRDANNRLVEIEKRLDAAGL